MQTIDRLHYAVSMVGCLLVRLTLGLNVMKPNTPRAKAPEFIPARIFIPARRMVDSKHSAVEVRSGAKDTSVTHSSLLKDM